MTTGTKIFLAVFALIIGVLVVYYGVMAPGSHSSGDGKVANNDKPREPAADHRDAVGPGAGGSAERDRAAPPPREPAPLAPQPAAPAPTAGSIAGGLLSEGVREAEHNNGLPSQGQVQPTDVPHSGAPPATPFLPLVGLNGGNLKSSTDDSPKGDVEPHSAPVANPSSPASVSPAAGASSAQPSRVPPQPPQRTAYTIKSGDTFVSIAEQWLGDKSKWSLIARENPTVDPQRLKIGQKIYLPSKDAARAAPKPEPVVANGEHLYIVQSGDTLSSIAREVFGDAKMWEEIYKQNQDAIGKDAGTLKVGMKLKLPKKTT